MSTMLVVCLVICVLTIAGYVWGKYSFGTVATFSIILFLLTGCISGSEVLSNISNSNVLMVLSMFVVSEGFNRTQFVKMIGRSVKAISKGSMWKVMLGFVLASVLAATLTGSAAAAFCIMAPIVTATCDELDINPCKVTFCVGLVCISACGIIPLGGSLAMMGELNGYIVANGYEQFSLGVMDLFKGRFLGLIAILAYCVILGHKMAPDKPVTKVGDSAALGARRVTRDPLKPFQERCGYLIFILVTVALVFNDQLNSLLNLIHLSSLDSWTIVFIGAVLMVVTGVLSSKDACSAIPLDMGFLIAGSLCMGTALANTGAGELIGNGIALLAGSLGNKYLIGAVFYLVPFILTQIMQNRSVMATFGPIAVLACKSLGVDCTGIMVLIGAACTTAFMTPMATPAVPMIMDIGGYDLKSQMKQSIIPAIVLSVVNVVWVMTVFSF